MLELSFNLRKQEISLINTLVHRALMICSKGKLSSKLDNIRSIMAENGYPDHGVNSSITRKIRNFRRPPSYGPKKCPVYLPWLGAISTRFEKQVASAVQHCYFSVEPHVCPFSCRNSFNSTLSSKPNLQHFPSTTIELHNRIRVLRGLNSCLYRTL